MQTVTQKIRGRRRDAPPLPSDVRSLRLVAGRPGLRGVRLGTSARPLPPRPPTKGTTYTRALTRRAGVTCVCVYVWQWKNRRETTLPNGPGSPFLSTYHYHQRNTHVRLHVCIKPKRFECIERREPGGESRRSLLLLLAACNAHNSKVEILIRRSFFCFFFFFSFLQ